MADESHRQRRMLGIAMGWSAAIFYTLANACLRQVVDADPVWVSCIKAFPTIVMVLPWCAWRVARKMTLVSHWKDVAWIVFGACMGQFVGNCLFQWSLGVVGLALAVPVTLGAVLIGSAFLGRWVLGESVTTRSWIGIAILVSAVFMLSLGAGEAYRTMHSAESDGDNSRMVLSGVAGVFVAGIAFSVLGMTIGRTSARGLPAPTILLVASLVGVFGLGTAVLIRDGWQIVLTTTEHEWSWSLAAGLFNGLAFISLTIAIHRIGLLNVNVLNASQTAIAALLGVVMFSEPITGALICGVVFTVVGLLLMPRSGQ